MPRYRVMFSKTGPTRYISHLDLLKAFERALRRAGLPMAFSQGFNPHPKISFAAPIPVGVSGEEEYMDIELTQELIPEKVKESLISAVPGGLKIKDVRQVEPRAKSTMAIVNRASYKVRCELEKDLSEVELENKIKKFLNNTDIPAMKKTKKGSFQTVNIRPGIYMLSGNVFGNSLELNMELAIGSVTNIRPEDVITKLQEFVDVGINPREVTISRTGLFVGDDTGVKSLWES
ncbi:TIGR03936 family radical SAM-associated protein [Desulfolucanica intricata]|uniref:TIGR03936 family radical SAM-associated protein n=1 Tax=Desulfolucanica intricata TaxID=1285191 RepID=UPI0008305F68|nr:TIGR03936 family radical SAM-associated protein [Desulfolucanica intricata]